MNVSVISRWALGALLSWSAAQAGASEFLRPGVSFALLGDVPYGVGEEGKFGQVVADINASRNVRFVLHTGDVKQGSERCDDAVFQRRFNQFQTLRFGFVVTPGDNDWTDCHRTNNGNYLPTERLARFRQIFFPTVGRTTGGKPFAVQSQAMDGAYSSYVENVMWDFSGALMATVHVVGSNNNLDPWNQIDASDSYATPRADRIAEFNAREAASVAWVDRVFDRAVAQGSKGVMLAMQANPNFDLAPTNQQRLGFNNVLNKIRDRAVAYGKPVLLVHGDSHYFRMDKPLVAPIKPSGSAMLENVTRLENFGSPSVHWVEVFVEPRDPNVFSVVQRLVPANFFPR